MSVTDKQKSGVQAGPGVPDLQEGLHPATWMLQISSPGMEASLGVDFAEIYRNTELFKYAPSACCSIPAEPSLRPPWPDHAESSPHHPSLAIDNCDASPRFALPPQ